MAPTAAVVNDDAPPDGPEDAIRAKLSCGIQSSMALPLAGADSAWRIDAVIFAGSVSITESRATALGCSDIVAPKLWYASRLASASRRYDGAPLPADPITPLRVWISDAALT